MKTILFAIPGNEQLADSILQQTGFVRGELEMRRFPDGESYIRILSDVTAMRCIIVCSLDRPDDKLLPLYFTCSTLRESDAARVELIAPYLGYMRQDKRFHQGEAVTSDAFAKLLSGMIDSLITVDPHLHRHHALSEIYSVPAQVIHAADAIAQWIRKNISEPVIIGPDEESSQWVEAIARAAGAPFEVLRKVRRGDRDVSVTLPQVGLYKEHTPVLCDDIISTARTMIETVQHLTQLGMKAPVCIGVHAVFAENAFEELKRSGAGRIITSNTILHATNEIDLTDWVVKRILT